MADMLNPAPKTSHHCLKSPMMHSASKRRQRKVHSKAIKTNNLRPSHNHNLELSHQHQTNSRHTTLRIPNNATLTIAITNNNMVSNKRHKISKMVLPRSSEHSLVMVAHKQTALLSNPNLDILTLERAKTVATRLQTRPPRLSNPELLKEANLNLVSLNSPKLEITHTATLTTPALTMLRTSTNIRTMAGEIIQAALMVLKVAFINNTQATVCLLELLMNILLLPPQAALEDLRCMVVTVH